MSNSEDQEAYEFLVAGWQNGREVEYHIIAWSENEAMRIAEETFEGFSAIAAEWLGNLDDFPSFFRDDEA